MPATQSLTFGNIESSVYGIPAVTQRKSTAGNRSPYRRKSASDEAFPIERLKAGDSEALETIFNTYSKKLYSVARRILGEAADTQEVIQDVFWTAFRKAQSFRGNSRFSTWLYRLTVNGSLNILRQRKKNREISFEAFVSKFRKDHHRVQPLVDWADTLEERYARREMRELLASALGVTVLSDLEGLSDKEIATALGLTVDRVRGRHGGLRPYGPGAARRDGHVRPGLVLAVNAVSVIACPVDYAENIRLTDKLGKLVQPI
jgi:RNA polymerase sigma-70 factor (ECF subfamily)